MKKITLIFVLELLACGNTSRPPGGVAQDAAADAATPSTWWELGDSLTYGVGTTPPTGYRELLYEWTRAQGLPVTFVGSGTVGSWPNAEQDGHPGFTIEQISTTAHNCELHHLFEPDLAIVLAGSNNMGRVVAYSATTTVADYAALLEELETDFPGMRLLVSTLPPMSPASTEMSTIDFNGRLPAVWDAFEAKHGPLLIRVDLHTTMSPWSATTFYDGVHPNAAGYAIMAGVFERAIMEVK